MEWTGSISNSLRNWALIGLTSLVPLAGGCSHTYTASRVDTEPVIQQDTAHQEAHEQYAVLLNSSQQPDGKFDDDIAAATRTLREAGFSDDHTYILEGNGEDSNEYTVDGAATAQNLETLSAYLEAEIDTNDTLFLYLASHGEQMPAGDSTESYIQLQDGRATAADIKGYLDGITPDTGLLVTNACYGGEIGRAAANGTTAAITQSKPDRRATESGFGNAFFTIWQTLIYSSNQPTIDTIYQRLKEHEEEIYMEQHRQKVETGNPEQYRDHTMLYTGAAIPPDATLPE